MVLGKNIVWIDRFLIFCQFWQRAWAAKPGSAWQSPTMRATAERGEAAQINAAWAVKPNAGLPAPDSGKLCRFGVSSVYL